MNCPCPDQIKDFLNIFYQGMSPMRDFGRIQQSRIRKDRALFQVTAGQLVNFLLDLEVLHQLEFLALEKGST
jgi:hypothetical protein